MQTESKASTKAFLWSKAFLLMHIKGSNDRHKIENELAKYISLIMYLYIYIYKYGRNKSPRSKRSISNESLAKFRSPILWYFSRGAIIRKSSKIVDSWISTPTIYMYIYTSFQISTRANNGDGVVRNVVNEWMNDGYEVIKNGVRERVRNIKLIQHTKRVTNTKNQLPQLKSGRLYSH